MELNCEIFPKSGFKISLEQKYFQRKPLRGLIQSFIIREILDDSGQVDYMGDDIEILANYILDSLIKCDGLASFEGTGFLKTEYLTVDSSLLDDKDSDLRLIVNYDVLEKVNRFIESYKKYGSLIKEAANYNQEDPRYFNLYECKTFEDVYDCINRTNNLNNAKRFGEKYLTNYSHLMYDDGVPRILNEDIAFQLSNLLTVYQKNLVSDEKIRDELSSVIVMDQDGLKRALDRLSNKMLLEKSEIKKIIYENDLDADIVYYEDFDEGGRTYIKINSFDASSILGVQSWCISNDEGYYDDYTYGTNSRAFKGFHIFVKDSSKSSSDPLSEFAFTVDACGNVTDAFDAKNDNIRVALVRGEIVDTDVLEEIIKSSLNDTVNHYYENEDRYLEWIQDSDFESMLNIYLNSGGELSSYTHHPLFLFNAMIGNQYIEKSLRATDLMLKQTIKDHFKFYYYTDNKVIEAFRDLLVYLDVKEQQAPSDDEIIYYLLEESNRDLSYAIEEGGDVYNLDISNIDDDDIDYAKKELGYNQPEINWYDILFSKKYSDDLLRIYHMCDKENRQHFLIFFQTEHFLQKLTKIYKENILGVQRYVLSNNTIPLLGNGLGIKIMSENIDGVLGRLDRTTALSFLGNIIISKKDIDDKYVDIFVNEFLKSEKYDVFSLINYLTKIPYPESVSKVLEKVPSDFFNNRLNTQSLVEIVSNDNILNGLNGKQIEVLSKSFSSFARNFDNYSGLSSYIVSASERPKYAGEKKIYEILSIAFDKGLLNADSAELLVDYSRVPIGDKEEIRKTIERQKLKESMPSIVGNQRARGVIKNNNTSGLK